MRDTPDDPEYRRIKTGMYVATWVALLSLGAVLFSGVLERQHNPNQSLQTSYENGAREVTLKRNRHGHYVTSGRINGHPVTFMLDTGATGVAVPATVADELGLERGPARPVRTANGTSVSYMTTLDRVGVGGIELPDVPAGIVPGLEGDDILLGMSFLKHIEFTQRGGTLTLRQYR